MGYNLNRKVNKLSLVYTKKANHLKEWGCKAKGLKQSFAMAAWLPNVTGDKPYSFNDRGKNRVFILDKYMSDQTSKQEKRLHRVVTFLDREHVDLLDKIGKDILFSEGTKLSRAKIISALVDILTYLNIDLTGIHSVKELEEKILSEFKKNKKEDK